MAVNPFGLNFGAASAAGSGEAENRQCNKAGLTLAWLTRALPAISERACRAKTLTRPAITQVEEI